MQRLIRLRTPPFHRTLSSQDAKESGQAKTRHAIRLFPVQSTCFAGLEEIKAAVVPLIAREFSAGDGDEAGSRGSYAIVWDSRSGPADLSRDKVISVSIRGAVLELPGGTAARWCCVDPLGPCRR